MTFLQINSDLLQFFRKQVDKTVFLNDSNCYQQSVCSGEVVDRASFLTGECVFEAASGGRCFFFLQWRVAQNSHDNMLTSVCCSTIKTVTGSEFVEKKLSIAFLF